MLQWLSALFAFFLFILMGNTWHVQIANTFLFPLTYEVAEILQLKGSGREKLEVNIWRLSGRSIRVRGG